MQMLKEKITVVIPCKNEGGNIYNCLKFVSKQEFSHDLLVVVADSSDESESLNWINKSLNDFSDLLKIKIIPGGFPAKARLEGGKLATTPYVLFLDADIMLQDAFILHECVAHNVDLVTVPFQTERGYNWIFRLFDIQQMISNWLGTPFAIGGFQLWKTEAYRKTGGYDETHLFAEDYWVSQKTKVMKIHKTKGVWTSARRFKSKGFFYMIWLSVKCYLNRNNSEFFKQHHNYWI
jgi:glycosyltransferase involved in cell wall biosynthesis